MTDPLAHLYAETGADDPDVDVELPVETVTLDELVNTEPDAETISDHDLEELVILVKALLAAGKMDDIEAVDLGLGVIADDELVLNDVGVAVFRRLVADHAIDVAIRQRGAAARFIVASLPGFYVVWALFATFHGYGITLAGESPWLFSPMPDDDRG